MAQDGDFMPQDPGGPTRAFASEEDPGGPTRAFVSEVMRQIGDLKVTCPEKRVAELFTTTSMGSFKPTENEYIVTKLGLTEDPEEARALVRPYYRALGRILFYCFGRNVTIDSIVMPELYRNYLLRGIDPEDKRYSIFDLVHDVARLLGLH